MVSPSVNPPLTPSSAGFLVVLSKGVDKLLLSVVVVVTLVVVVVFMVVVVVVVGCLSHSGVLVTSMEMIPA